MRLQKLLYPSLATVLLALPAAAQLADVHSGVWLQSLPPENGLGGWWDLRADGSAIYNWGAMAEAHYFFDGTLLTVIPGGDRKDRPRYQIRFDGDSMYSRADEKGAPEAQYRRVEPENPHSPAAGTTLGRLVGRWASVAAPKATMPTMADMPGMTGPAHDMPSFRTFTADGLYQVRIVYSTRQGHWDSSNKTIRLDGEPEQHFVLKDGTLIISGVAYRPN